MPPLPPSFSELRPAPSASRARRAAYQIVFEHESALGRGFDVALIVAILASVAAVMLESIAGIRASHGELLRGLEWWSGSSACCASSAS